MTYRIKLITDNNVRIVHPYITTYNDALDILNCIYKKVKRTGKEVIDENWQLQIPDIGCTYEIERI